MLIVYIKIADAYCVRKMVQIGVKPVSKPHHNVIYRDASV